MIRSTDVRPWFAHAVTVSLSLSLLIAVGMYAREELLRDQPFLGHQFYSGCKWAAITCAVIAGPVTGGLAQTSLERVLGTIIGGVTGLAVFWLSTPVATQWEWALYSITAGLFGWTAVWMGHKFSLNYSFKLAVITFLLVFAGADTMEEAKAITIARTAGIVAGVLLTLALAVTVYPVSAHYQHEMHLSHSLDALLALHALCWVPLTFAHAPPPGAAPAERSAAGSEVPSMRSVVGLSWEAAAPGEGGWGGVNTGFVKRPEFAGAAYGVDRLRVGDDDEVQGAEETVVEVYTALHNADAALPLLEREIYIARCAGRPFYLPRFFAVAVGLGGRRRMPAAAARSAAAAVRGVARVQLSLHNLLRDGVDGIVKDVLCERYPAALLPDIVKLARSAIQDCIESLERGEPVCTVSLHHLRTAVATLITISGAHRSRVHRQYRLYRDTAHDLRQRLHHHASVATARRRSRCSSSQRGAADAAVAVDATGSGSTCRASVAEDSARGAAAGALSRLLSAFSMTRKPPASVAESDNQGLQEPLLHIRTERSAPRSRPSTPGSHDGDHHGATSPFSALRRDSTTILSPTAIRLSFAVHRDIDIDLTPPHPSHPAAAAAAGSEPPPRLSGSSLTRADILPPTSAHSHGLPKLPPSGPRHKRAPSLTLQRFASEPGPAQLPSRRGLRGDVAGHFPPPSPAQDGSPSGRGRRLNGAAPSRSPSHPRHSRSHSAHSSPLKDVADFRAILISDLSSSRTTSPADRSHPGTSRSRSCSPCRFNAGTANASPQANVFERSNLALPTMHPHDSPQTHAAGSAGLARYSSAVETAQRAALADVRPPEAGDSMRLTVAYPSPESSGQATAVHEGSHRAKHGVAPEAASGDRGVVRRPSRSDLAAAAAADGPEGGGGSGMLQAAEAAAQVSVLQRGNAAGSPAGAGGAAGSGGTAAAAAAPMVPTVAPHTAAATVFLSMSPSNSAGGRSALPRVSSDAGSAVGQAAASLRSAGSTGLVHGRPSLIDRAPTLTEPKNLLLFPDTPEGHYAQITFYAFQFQLEELVDGLEELQAAFSTLVRVMPRHGSTRHSAAGR